MVYRLVNLPTHQLQDLEEKIQRGGRFVVFPYAISFLVVTMQQLSPAIYISGDKDLNFFARKYVRKNYQYGLWAIPWGIIKTFDYLKAIREGGLDVTEDIMLNLTQENLYREEVLLNRHKTVLKHPEPEEIKSLKRTKNIAPNHASVPYLVWVLFKCSKRRRTLFLLGIAADEAFELAEPSFREAVYSQFYKRIPFLFVDMNSVSDWSTLLKEQGIPIQCNLF
ncbi:MAG: hypothetical protein HWD58_01740 [Bacteroidota bacterium]|nr:MAG: hypothetical protein HWD58_01740 [Bacteroidota bacterium]